MIHNASIEQYREPIGAVTKGEEVKLRLFALEGTAATVEVVLFSEEYHKTFPMREKKGIYECIIEMPEKACILWYYFRITEGKLHVLLRSKAGTDLRGRDSGRRRCPGLSDNGLRKRV